jgi:hypothetical protein
MAINIGIGLSTEMDTLAAAQNAARQAKSNIHSTKIDLALVFSSTEFAHSTVLKTIGGLLGPIPMVGCSSLGIISNQGIFIHGIIVLLLELPEGIYLNTACLKEISAKSSINAGEELGEKLLYGFKNIRRDLSVILSDGLIKDESGFLFGLQERLGRSFPLAGGSASDNLSFKKTYLYFDGQIYNDSVCAILWGGKLNFGLGTKHGWKPLGKPRYVNKSSGNVVYEIDGVPAVNIYKDYFAYDLDRLRKELTRISVLYPLGIYLAGEEEYLLRNIVSIEGDGTLVFQGSVPEKSSVRLMIGTKESCLAATLQAVDDVKKGLLDKPCNFALVFDSVSRYILLGRQAEKELQIIKERLGRNTPLIGVYTFGEQAPLKSINYQGKAYFHNQTISILGIGG